MAWTGVQKAPLQKSEKLGAPEGLWIKCNHCKSVIYRRDFEVNQCVCTVCNYHYPIAAIDRLGFFLDPNSFNEMDIDLVSTDPLSFSDTKSYKERLASTQKHLGMKDALVSGEGILEGMPVQVAAMDFRFMGGSMGAVVGEKIARTFLRAVEKRQPAIVFSSSGGARMQEGIVSLMQMAKTCAALSRMRDRGIPMVSVMAHPTTGGVAASYAMLGDINVAEPAALIGFAGPRVIRQTIGQELPEGFQKSEFLMDHGMLDLILHRDTMREKISQILRIVLNSRKLSHA
jgi:acetyl-CoA carboxylase carboxyl transferase subunit beta